MRHILYRALLRTALLRTAIAAVFALVMGWVLFTTLRWLILGVAPW